MRAAPIPVMSVVAWRILSSGGPRRCNDNRPAPRVLQCRTISQGEGVLALGAGWRLRSVEEHPQ